MISQTHLPIVLNIVQYNLIFLRIRSMKKLTDKSWGVNLTILPTIGAPPPYDEYAKVVIEEGVKVIETAGTMRNVISFKM